MKTELFDYDLPLNLIAQHPLKDRDRARLLLVDRNTRKIEDKIFSDIIRFLHKGDCLVLNNTQVIPARLFGIRTDTGAKVEFFLLSAASNDAWNCLCRPARRVKQEEIFTFKNDLKARILEEGVNGERTVKFFDFTGDFLDFIQDIGEIPLPPYIKSRDVPFSDYQTIYAKKKGAVAAPTAGLHFTRALLNEITRKGVSIVFLTLHCGIGTFKPVRAENIEDHLMHFEYYELTSAASDKIRNCKECGGEIWAAGTTTVRTLESIMHKYGRMHSDIGETNLFIYPPFKFQIVDHIITNFHLPKSTLLMLVSAFAGYDLTMKSYNYAISEAYRFFSFGDAMMIL